MSTPELAAHVLTGHPLVNSVHGSETPPNRVENIPGYTTPVFKGKEEQRALVENDVASKVIIYISFPCQLCS